MTPLLIGFVGTVLVIGAFRVATLIGRSLDRAWSRLFRASRERRIREQDRERALVAALRDLADALRPSTMRAPDKTPARPKVQ